MINSNNGQVELSSQATIFLQSPHVRNVKNLASKASKNHKDIKTLVDQIAHFRAKAIHTEQDLLDLITLIEDFYTQ